MQQNNDDKPSAGKSKPSDSSAVRLEEQASIFKFSFYSTKNSKRLLYHDSEENDTFMFSGVEDLVPFVEKGPADEKPYNSDYEITRYRSRVEDGFPKIERIMHPEYGMWWKVTIHENIVTLLGKSPEYRIADPADQNRLFKSKV